MEPSEKALEHHLTQFSRDFMLLIFGPTKLEQHLERMTDTLLAICRNIETHKHTPRALDDIINCAAGNFHSGSGPFGAVKLQSLRCVAYSSYRDGFAHARRQKADDAFMDQFAYIETRRNELRRARTTTEAPTETTVELDPEEERRKEEERVANELAAKQELRKLFRKDPKNIRIARFMPYSFSSRLKADLFRDDARRVIKDVLAELNISMLGEPPIPPENKVTE
jgi:hypothetical protein